MKRDWTLVVKVLRAINSEDDKNLAVDKLIKHFPCDDVYGTIRLCVDAGLIRNIRATRDKFDNITGYVFTDAFLTMLGHDVIDYFERCSWIGEKARKEGLTWGFLFACLNRKVTYIAKTKNETFGNWVEKEKEEETWDSRKNTLAKRFTTR